MGVGLLAHWSGGEQPQQMAVRATPARLTDAAIADAAAIARTVGVAGAGTGADEARVGIRGDVVALRGS